MTTKTVESVFPELGTPTAPVPTSSPTAIFSIRVCVCVRACVRVPLSLNTENERKRRKNLQLLSSLHKTKNEAKTSANQFYRLQKKNYKSLLFSTATLPLHSCDNSLALLRQQTLGNPFGEGARESASRRTRRETNTIVASVRAAYLDAFNNLLVTY
jgi:hypothetical protein